MIVGNTIYRSCITLRRLNQLTFYGDDPIILFSLTARLMAVRVDEVMRWTLSQIHSIYFLQVRTARRHPPPDWRDNR